MASRHRQLGRPLTHCTSWQEFVGRSEARKILSGFGVMDEEVLFEPRRTYRCASLPTFDLAADCWSVWWYDGRTPARLEPPVTGRFAEDIGVFPGECAIEGILARMRSLGNRQNDAPRCEQSLSLNKRQTWETSWITEFRGVFSAAAQLSQPNGPPKGPIARGTDGLSQSMS